MVKLESMLVNISYSKAPIIKSIINSPNSAAAVIEDIVENNIHYLHDDGRVSTELNHAWQVVQVTPTAHLNQALGSTRGGFTISPQNQT